MGTYKLIGRILFALILFVFGSYIVAAQQPISGEWKADHKENQPNKIQISFDVKYEKNGRTNRNQNSSTYDFNDLSGLSLQQTQGGNVSFSIKREAGSIDCEGRFDNGRGSGKFTFNPDPSYVQGMISRGFNFKDEELLTAAHLGLSLSYTDSLLSADFGKLETQDLFKAHIFKVTPEFLTEMRATGFPELGMEEVVKAKIFKIDPEYVRNIKDAGFGVENFENLVKYKIFKVTPEYLNELRNEGLTSLSTEDVVQFRIFRIEAKDIRQARAEDPDITAEKIVKKRISGWGK